MVSPSSRCPDGQHLDEQRSWTGCKVPAAPPPSLHANTPRQQIFFSFLVFLRATSSSRTREPEREIYFHSHVMRRGHTVICSSRRRQTFETQILLHVAHSNFIPPERRDSADDKRNFFWGGGTSMTKKKSSTKCQKMVYL